LHAFAIEVRNEVLVGECVDRDLAERPQGPSERDAVKSAGAVGDVDAGGSPSLGRIAQRRPLRRPGLDEREVGEAELGELALDRGGAERRQSPRSE
jgi:hypothetical protein